MAPAAAVTVPAAIWSTAPWTTEISTPVSSAAPLPSTSCTDAACPDSTASLNPSGMMMPSSAPLASRLAADIRGRDPLDGHVHDLE